MVISKVQHIINALEKILPKSFIFVLDTTDRSFIYKSQNRQDCIDKIILLDQTSGIDQLTKNLEFYSCEQDNYTLFLRKLSLNTFLGTCMFVREYDKSQLTEAKRIMLG